ncbi:MAG: hypothetical protein P9M08_07835 [Candidatus Erginobacter occultus]|nr:hypothetical protein [Candidatus Erginobacter occultus]
MKPRLNLLKWTVLFLAGAGFLWLKRYGFHFTVGGDENTYYYMARLMSEGKLFYRDFFYAHPPLNLLVLTLVYRVFGFHLAALKLTASLPVLVAAAPLYLRFWRKNQGGSGILFLVILLLNYELLKVTTHPFGVSLAAAFLMASLYCFLEDRPLAAGIFWGVASVTGLYALPWGAVPVVYYLLSGAGRRLLPKFILGFLLVFGTVNAACLLLFQESYYTPVYLYHLLKPSSPEAISDLYIRTLRRNVLIFFLPFLYAWVPKTGKKTAILAAALLYLVILGGINPLFTQYFMLPIPFLAWIGAVSLAGVIRSFPSGARRWPPAAAALVLLAVFSGDNIARYIQREKIIGFVTEEPCRRFIVENSRPGDLLFGHVTTVPLLALLTGREIALDMVDTNHMRFRAGLADIDQTMEKLRNEPRLKFIIIQENRFWTSPEVESHLARWSPAAYFDEPRGRIVIYDCRPEQ